MQGSPNHYSNSDLEILDGSGKIVKSLKGLKTFRDACQEENLTKITF